MMKRSLSVGELPDPKTSQKRRRRKAASKKSENFSQDVIDHVDAGVVAGGDGADGCSIPDEEFSQQQNNNNVDNLKAEIQQLKAVVMKMRTQVDFLLSYIGVDESIISVGISDPSTEASLSAVAPPSLSVGVATSMVKTSDNPGAGSNGVTYAEALRRRSTLNPVLKQAVVSAVYSDFAEHDRRSRNVVITGLSDQTGDEKLSVERLLQDEFGKLIRVVRCRRLGRLQGNRVRPVLAVLSSATDAEFLIQNARQLRSSTNPEVRSSVYINADLTKAEALAAYQDRCRRRELAGARRNHIASRVDDGGLPTGAASTHYLTVNSAASLSCTVASAMSPTSSTINTGASSTTTTAGTVLNSSAPIFVPSTTH